METTKSPLRPVLVSSCLLGLATRYDGSDNFSTEVDQFLRKHRLLPIPVCPEQLAGLSTPRPKCWFSQGDGQAIIAGQGQLIDETGVERSNDFLQGAHQTLAIAKRCDCQLAILKQRSPSCGADLIYLNQQRVAGMGVTAALLRQHGLTLFSEDKLPADGHILCDKD